MTPHERLERTTWDLFWLPDGVTVIDRPELLALHTARPLPYLNAVYRTRADAARLPALVQEVRALHGNGVSRWNVTDNVESAPLERALAAAGYAAGHVHDARVIDVHAFAPRGSSGVDIRRVTDEATLRDCWRVGELAFDQDGHYTKDDVGVELAACAAADARVQRFVAYIDGEPVSAGGINLYPALGFGFLWAGGTVPSARHRGAYSAVVAARVRCAVTRGVRHVGLYARTGTSSPVVQAQGFSRVGTMTYWER